MAAPLTLEVFIDIKGRSLLAGVAYLTIRRGKVTTFFEYAEDYLADESSVDLSPHIRRSDRSVTTFGLPGAFADSAPDRWGRNLISRRIRAEARVANSAIPTITELDYLCGLGDLTRQGALRFRARGDESFLSESNEVPLVLELPALLAASNKVANNSDDLAAIKLLLAAGSASLGGARPKASVRDGHRLCIAKFPHPNDQWDVMAWEATTLELAAQCEIVTPRHQLVKVANHSVLLLDRFDRLFVDSEIPRRVPYISAMTLLDRIDGAESDYLEIAETLVAHGGNVQDDLRQMWRRIAFSVAVNNVDDHLRNHGFLLSDQGWILSPLFDVNPHPDPTAQRVTSLLGATDRVGCLSALFECAPRFGLSTAEAGEAWSQIRATVSDWRVAANKKGVGASDQHLFAEVLDDVPQG
jgi:serine/threonine-protein kinase HipA